MTTEIPQNSAEEIESTEGEKRTDINRYTSWFSKRIGCAMAVFGLASPPVAIGTYAAKTLVETAPQALEDEALRQAHEQLRDFQHSFIAFIQLWLEETSLYEKSKMLLTGAYGALEDIIEYLTRDDLSPGETFERIFARVDRIIQDYPQLTAQWNDLKNDYQDIGKDFEALPMADAVWQAFKEEVKSDISNLLP